MVARWNTSGRRANRDPRSSALNSALNREPFAWARNGLVKYSAASTDASVAASTIIPSACTRRSRMKPTMMAQIGNTEPAASACTVGTPW
jgi:hypothetical protein